MNVTPYSLAERYVGVVEELYENGDHPLISWWHSLCREDGRLDTPDEVPWCSAFMQDAPWRLRLPRSKSAMARSWLKVGTPIPLSEAKQGYDVVVLWRGNKDFGVLGHVGFFSSLIGKTVYLLGGNQRNKVGVDGYQVDRVIGVRRLQ